MKNRQFQVPTGRVSGRRSVRPLKDIQFTYRSAAGANDSSSSLNATVGSTIHNESINTPYVSQFAGRKRREDTFAEHDGFIDSPSKRSRIDFSGFLGYVTTPVTMIKNRLSRVGLSSSTPRKLDDQVEEVQIADVSAAADVTGADEAHESQMEVVEDDLKKEKLVDDDIQIKETPIAETSANRSFCSVM